VKSAPIPTKLCYIYFSQGQLPPSHARRRPPSPPEKLDHPSSHSDVDPRSRVGREKVAEAPEVILILATRVPNWQFSSSSGSHLGGKEPAYGLLITCFASVRYRTSIVQYVSAYTRYLLDEKR